MYKSLDVGTRYFSTITNFVIEMTLGHVVTLPFSTGKLGFDPDIWNNKLTLSGYVEEAYLTTVPKVPKKSGGGFFQNGGIMESIFNVIVAFFKWRSRSNEWTHILNFCSKMSVFNFSLRLLKKHHIHIIFYYI